MQDAFAHCEALVQAADKDRFIATLFAPPDRRPALFALYAFNLEVARVRSAVHNPVAGEIRLQWWSDALGGQGRGEVAGNPVAAALIETLRRHSLPERLLREIVEARRFDLYDDPMPALADLERYADAVSTNLVALAALVLDAGHAPNPLTMAAGRAFAMAGLLKAFPAHAARGQLYVPLDMLQRHGAGREAALSGSAAPPLRAALGEMRQIVRDNLAWGRDLIGRSPPELVPALLPVAPVGALLDRMDRPGYDPFVPVDLPQWRRQWRIWRAARDPVRVFS